MAAARTALARAWAVEPVHTCSGALGVFIEGIRASAWFLDELGRSRA